MSRGFLNSALLGATALAAVAFAGPAWAGEKGRVSIRVETESGAKVEVETGAGWLSGLLADADVRCEIDEDRDTRKMIASLSRQGEGGVYRGEDEDGGEYVARRRAGMLRIDKAGEDGERTLVEMPWDVAQCLMAGVEPAGPLGARLARGEAKLRFETSGGDGAKVSIRLE